MASHALQSSTVSGATLLHYRSHHTKLQAAGPYLSVEGHVASGQPNPVLPKALVHLHQLLIAESLQRGGIDDPLAPAGQAGQYLWRGSFCEGSS